MPTSSEPTTVQAAVTDGIDGKLVQIRKFIAGNKLAAAREISDSILAQFPNNTAALIQRSRLETADDNYRLASELAASAQRSGVRDKWECIALLRRLRAFNLSQELEELSSHLPSDLALDPDVAKAIAQSFQHANKPQIALESASRAANENPGSAALQAVVGTSLVDLGLCDEAENHFQQCLRIDPAHASAWWQLSRLCKRDSGSHRVDELRRAIKTVGQPRKIALLAFALHREFDAMEDHREATGALTLACTSMRKTLNYDPSEDKQLFTALKSLQTNQPLQHESAAETPEFTPLFVVGMNRSGTKILEYLLTGHSEICSGGEPFEFTSHLRFAADHHCDTELDIHLVKASPRFDYQTIGRRYLIAANRRRTGQRFVTDRLPSNFLNIAFILHALPHAKILHVSRDPIETCFSALREPFPANICRYSYDQTELGGYYRQYFSLMQHWRQRFPGRIHDVAYTALITDPIAELKRVASYLGLQFQPGMLERRRSDDNPAVAASTEKLGSWLELPLQPKWEPYREYLTPLSWRLSDVGQRF